jgi:hypothetical protein
MVRKVVLSILLVLILFPASYAFSKPVSEHYFVDEYVAMRNYHKSVDQLLQKNPDDKTLQAFALNLLKDDLTAFENMDPPEEYFEMKTRVVGGIRAHIASLQASLRGKPGAKKLWEQGDGSLQWADDFLMQRDWRIDNIPLEDAGFTPDEAQLTNAQYADRYFLIRTMNQKMGAEMLQGKKGGAGIDQTERTLNAQIAAWKGTRYPKEMQAIHDQVLNALQMSKQWVDLVKAGKSAEAQKTDDAVDSLYKKIDQQLASKFKIQVPDFSKSPQ